MKLKNLPTFPFALLLAAASLPAQVTSDRLLKAAQEPQNWLTYSGSYAGQRHSGLTQIAPQNVRDLELKWVFQARSFEKFEATPLVVDGVLYTVQAPNDVVALDAATGRVFWMYNYTPSKAARPCCGRINRGLAVAGDLLFMGTIDAHLIAIDAKSGKSVWNTAVARAESGYALTHAPLVVKDNVIVGVAGGEFGIRGFIAAYNIRTGKEVWKFYTIPGPGEPGNETWAGDSWKHGGGSAWVTGAYDPDLNLTYWGVGNPGPDWNGDKRQGDNLYTDSVVALDADTGKLKWHYQFSPHDEFDYDSVQVPVLAEIDYQGQPRKVMLWANRNGMYYTLDRTTGQFLVGKPFTQVNWANGFDEKGRPMRVAGKVPSREGTLIYPSNQGATNWYSPSFSPRTGLFYIPAWADTWSVYVKTEEDFVEGQRYSSGMHNSSFGPTRGAQNNTRKPEDGHGAVIAIDPKTGGKKWQFDLTDVTDAGILTTDSDLLFSGSREEYFYALDARSGSLLWKTALGGAIANGPITYSVGGKQYVAVAAGNSLYAFGLR
ncbi:MAG TPA: PQQ-dependent dehydrogenase, methanol/ethanol family [Bryobacteraceae bacterium]|nr:PQQ-dependent dehydrogenase, methanol/ethanol family [Bryobacteraceae bacterium]